MDNLKALKEQRNAKLSELKEIQKTAEKEIRSLTKSEHFMFDALEKEIQEIDRKIRSMGSVEKKGINIMEKRELRDQEIQVSEEIRTAMGGAGVTVPTALSGDIVKDMRETCGVYADCKIVNFAGDYKQIKRKNGNSSAWTDELQEISPSNAEYESVDLGSFKCSGLDVLSLEVVNQSGYNIVNEIRTNMAESLGDAVETAIFKGTGVKQPKGLLTEIGDLTAEELTTDALIDMTMGVKARYLNGAKWYMSRSALAKIKKLKGADGHFIFDPQNRQVLGFDVRVTDALTDEIVFGNFKVGYVFKQAPNMQIQVLREKYAEKGGIGVVAHLFGDGKVVDLNAFVVKKVTETATMSARKRA